jgi:EAL domain-containing protein (putative c-di-GMP-specific phosphodiesterase class I)
MDRPHSEAIFKAIVELAHGLGLPVIAEGVEDEHTRQELMGLGCDALQGFHLSPPLPASEIETWLGLPSAR